jgi:hypothetical protein
MVPEMGSGHRAGGADLASGVDTAGTVARIDLRLPQGYFRELTRRNQQQPTNGLGKERTTTGSGYNPQNRGENHETEEMGINRVSFWRK